MVHGVRADLVGLVVTGPEHVAHRLIAVGELEVDAVTAADAVAKSAVDGYAAEISGSSLRQPDTGSSCTAEASMSPVPVETA